MASVPTSYAFADVVREMPATARRLGVYRVAVTRGDGGKGLRNLSVQFTDKTAAGIRYHLLPETLSGLRAAVRGPASAYAQSHKWPKHLNVWAIR